MREPGHRIGLLLACTVGCGSPARAGETIAYSYDSLGRLERVEHRGTVNDGIKAQYAYDMADNRTRVTVSGMPAVAGGSFEAPEVGAGYVYPPAGGPATFTGNAGIAGNGSAWGFAAAPDGDQVAFIQSAGVVSAVSLPVTGLAPGASYKVRFRIALRPGYGANPVTVSFGGVMLGTFTPGSTGFTSVVSAAFTASGPSGTVTFTGSGAAADLGTAIDLVTLEAGPTAVGGGFEAPNVGTGYVHRPADSPAAFAGNSGVAGNGSAWGFAAAPQGSQVAFMQSYGTASTINLQVKGLTPGSSYTARFWIAARPGYGANPVTVAYEGVVLGTFTPGSAAFTAVTSAAFAASAETGRLSFTGSASAADLGTGLDRVTVAVAGSH